MKNKEKWILTLLLTVLLLGGIATLLWRTGFFQAVGSMDALQAYIQRWTPHSHVMFFLIQFASVVLAPIPSNITAVVGALLFGTVPAFLITAAAVISGSMVVFAVARVLGRDFADRVVNARLSDRYRTVIRTKRDSFLALAFLFPFFPDDILCILAGVTDIPPLRFFILVTLTRPWGLLVACVLGGSAMSIPWWGTALLVAAGVALFLLGMKYGDRIEDRVIQALRRRREK